MNIKDMNIKDLIIKVKKIISWPLGIFVVVTLVGAYSKLRLEDDHNLTKLYDAFDVGSAVALALLAFMVYARYGSQLKPISIVIKQDGSEKELNVKILRKNFTRSELMGVLGVIHKSPEKFEIAHIATTEFFKDLEDVQENRKDSLVLMINENDTFEPKECFIKN